MARRTYRPVPLSAAALARIEQTARTAAEGAGSAQQLAAAVVALSHAYTRDREHLAEHDATRSALFARMGFFLPRDLAKVFGPLDELRASALFSERKRLRVLDVGAGLGATSLGLARWLRLRGTSVERLEVVALERNERALRGFQQLLKSLSELSDEFAPIELTARASDLEQTRLTERFDLVLFGFVLNELFTTAPLEERIARRAEVLREASARLAHGGAIIVLEPALKESSRELMMLRDALVERAAAPYVIAPCLHAQSCPMLRSERDWCHQELQLALPPPIAEIARAASLRYEGLSYASLVLANAPRTAPSPQTFRVVSDRLESKGKLELYGCGEAGYVRLSRLSRHESLHNAVFDEARRGDVIRISEDGARIAADTRVTREG